jgi:hypothetical protein
MKLRLRENSLRLRLLRSEVERLGRNERVEEVITFAARQRLTYSLAVTDATVVSATFEGGTINVELPSALARQFVESDLVTVEHQQPAGPGGPLTILIEKDFVCLDRNDDPDNVDAYPHPTGNCD